MPEHRIVFRIVRQADLEDGEVSVRIDRPIALILGSGGQVGRQVVDHLAQTHSEIQTRITTRTAAKVAELRTQGFDAVLLDLDRPETFAGALRGVDRVFLLTGYTVAMLAQSKTFIDAARKAAVRHIVHLGTFGRWDCTDPHIAWHQLIETYIEASGIAWTHVHPNMFMEQIPKLLPIRDSRFPIYWGKGSMGWVAARDIGASVAAILKGGPARHGGKNYWLSVELAGGERLAELFSEVLERQIVCDYRSPEDFARLQAIDPAGEPWYSAAALEFLRQFSDGRMADFGVIRDDTPFLLDTPALTLHEWMMQNRNSLES